MSIGGIEFDDEDLTRIVFDNSNGLTSVVLSQNSELDQDKDGKWVCPLVESSQEFKNYLEVYRQTLKDMDDEDKAGITNEVTLNDKKVAEAYSEYWFYVQMNGADDCIKDFYLQLYLSSSSLKFTLLSLVSLFLIIA